MKPLLTFAEIFPYLLVLVRITSALMTLPGFGDTYVPPRVRMMVGMSFAAIIGPLVAPRFPTAPSQALLFFVFLSGEALVGFFIGITVRFVFVALDVGGATLGFQAGLTQVFVTNPNDSSQTTLPATFLGVTAALLLFLTDSHYLIIKTFIESYQGFPVGFLLQDKLFLKDLLVSLLYVLSLAFITALQIAGPFIIIGLALFIALGLLNRLMPQLPVFFVAQPFQIVLGLVIFMLVMASCLSLFMERLTDVLINLWDPKVSPF